MVEGQRRRETGSALFVAVMMLMLMGGLGLAALDTVTRDRQVAGFQSRGKNAFYAADAAGAAARNQVRSVGSRSDKPAFPTQGAPQTLGDSTVYDREATLPRYYGDPAVTDPIRYIRDGTPYMSGGNLKVGGQKLVHTLWQANVVGESAAGGATRIELMETKILSSGY